MKSGILFEQGEIIIVPFPFSDLSTIKQRPVLILSKNEYNNQTGDIITCGITSNIKDAQCSILLESNNLKEGVIPSISRIKVDKLFTIDKNLVKKKLAMIDLSTFEKVKQEFSKLI